MFVPFSEFTHRSFAIFPEAWDEFMSEEDGMIWSRQFRTHCPRHIEQVQLGLYRAETGRKRKRGRDMVVLCIIWNWNFKKPSLLETQLPKRRWCRMLLSPEGASLFRYTPRRLHGTFVSLPGDTSTHWPTLFQIRQAFHQRKATFISFLYSG